MTNANNNLVTGNNVINNAGIGILMYDGSTNNTITSNHVAGNGANIQDSVGGNIISGNT